MHKVKNNLQLKTDAGAHVQSQTFDCWFNLTFKKKQFRCIMCSTNKNFTIKQEYLLHQPDMQLEYRRKSARQLPTAFQWSLLALLPSS